MSGPNPDLRAIFCEALEKPSPSELEQYLQAACGDNAGLRADVEALLASHRQAGSFLFLGESTPGFAETVAMPFQVEQPATQIGPYKLLHQIGEGGFGAVYVAEQLRPVRRKVALKIIKPGMDSREVIARFEAERQALAMMDHPNIAQVLDVGTTDRGRPYFVMELVRGVPITEYCDSHGLTPRQRLQLFVGVCHAVQHAHQKGIIHRDIKPSNILVTLQNDEPTPKVIDFGVSKALNQQLTERTLFTAYGQMIGTPQYMSPEQAEMSGLDIDTRSDVYALGVLLYELLTGTTPLDGKRLRELGYAEMQRVIREEEPPKPSLRVSTLGQQATVVAQHRNVDARRLRDQLAGELDWIVMRALEKERGRRYETANAFAQDIDNYLNHNAVSACPPSTAYRLRKFARRNRALLGTATLISLLLVAVTAVNLFLAARALKAERLADRRRSNEQTAREAADRARQSEVQLRKQVSLQRDIAVAAEREASQQRALAVKAEQRAAANFRQARRAVDQYLATIQESHLLQDPDMGSLRSQLLEAAGAFYQSIVEKQRDADELSLDVAAAHYRRGQVLDEFGDHNAARKSFQAARSILQQLTAEAPTPQIQLELADTCLRLNDHAAARRWCEAVLAEAEDSAPARRILHRTHRAQADQHQALGRPEDALQSYEQALLALAPLTTVDAPSARDLAELCETQLAEAQLHRRAGNPAGALATARAARDEAERARALEPQTARYGELAAVCQRCIARLLRQDEHVDESVASYRRATATWSKLAFEHPATPRLKADLMKTWRELADYQRGLGRVEEAEWTERRINRYLAEMPRALGEDFFQLAIVYAQLAAPPGDDDPAPELDHETRRNDDCQRAVDALSEALKLGFQPQIQLSTHPLLVHLVARDDFRQLAARARAQFDSDRVSTRPHDSHVDAQPDLHLRLLMLASQIGIAEVLDETGQRQEALQVLERNVAQVDELTPQQPDNNIAIMAAKGNALYAIADAHWRARRYLPAKRAWDQGFALLQEAHAAAPETKRAELARTISQHELDLIDVYGGVGAWREAGIHRGRYIAFDQIATAAVEARYSFLTLVAEAGESYEAACRYVLERHATEDPSHTAWLLSLAEQHVLDPAELVELAKQQEKSAEPSWFNTVVGYCQRRAGEGVAALRNLDPGVWAQFDRALALSQSGDDHGARLLMDIAESSYASLMRDWLASAQLRDANGQARVNDFWWEMIRLQLIRAEARRVIAQEAEADPWAALLEARAAVIVGDAERAEAAFRQAVELAPDDARVWATRAETRAVLQQTKLTESDFAQALQLEPQNPEWWIARGKYHLEHGRDVEADADYQRAAELSPNDLDVFLRTGVWAVGPYPAAMNQSFAVEGQPHPSRAVTAQGSGGEESLEPYSWIRIPIHRLGNNWGEVALNDITQRSANVSAYALGFVYATQARTASLMVSSGQHLRLWINGVCVYDDPNSTESFELLDRIPISLQRGRNSILVRISTKAPNCSFMMRLADCPSERALTAARLMQWPEAVAAFEKLPAQQLVTSGHYWAIYCKCLAAAQYGERLEEAIRVEYPLRRYTSNEFAVTELLRAGTMFPATAITSEQWRELAEEAGQPTRSWQKIAKGRGLYRGGALADAVDYYKRQPELADDWEALAVVAMAYHRLGRSDQASQTLQSLNNKFQKWAEARVNATGFVVPGPMTSAHRWALLVEANRVVRGVEMTADPIYARLRQKITAELEAIRLELEDHDLALMFKPDDPRLFAARAQRFAELSRWDEAEADFQTATQLKPDPFVWLALGRYWELRDNTKQSAVAYLRAIELDRAQDWDQLIRKRLTSNEPLFQSILKARPMDADLWTLRGEQLCADGRWGEAAQVWAQRITQGQNDAFSLYQLALLQAGAGDPDAVRETCRTMAERLAVEEPAQATNFMAWACAVSPGALADYGSALESARRFTNANLASAFAHETLGALLLRSGQFVKALEELTTANELNDASEQLTTTSPAYVWYLLAITHGRMGNADEARQWFDKATRWVERAAKEQEQGTRAPWPWNRRLTLELLQREAAQAAPSVSAQKAATP